jgi:hypothetical protein
MFLCTHALVIIVKRGYLISTVLFATWRHGQQRMRSRHSQLLFARIRQAIFHVAAKRDIIGTVVTGPAVLISMSVSCSLTIAGLPNTAGTQLAAFSVNAERLLLPSMALLVPAHQEKSRAEICFSSWRKKRLECMSQAQVCFRYYDSQCAVGILGSCTYGIIECAGSSRDSCYELIDGTSLRYTSCDSSGSEGNIYANSDCTGIVTVWVIVKETMMTVRFSVKRTDPTCAPASGCIRNSLYFCALAGSCYYSQHSDVCCTQTRHCSITALLQRVPK